MNELQPGDFVKIVSTNDDTDLTLVGKVGIVAQIYNGTIDIQIEQEYKSLSRSTIVRRIDADDTNDFTVNPFMNSGMYHIEYTMDKSTKMVAHIYEKQQDGSYKEVTKLDVDTLIWKSVHENGVD